MNGSLNSNGYGNQVSETRIDDLDTRVVSYMKKKGNSSNYLELGCGTGSLSKEVSKYSRNIYAIDKFAYPELKTISSMKFFLCSLPSIPDEVGLKQFDCIVSQRMMHYLTYEQSIITLKCIEKITNLSGRIFISVSGIESELSSGYLIGNNPVEQRYGRLSDQMARTHCIKYPVCLYSLDEACELLEVSGFEILEAWLSEFGNVKLVAQKKRG